MPKLIFAVTTKIFLLIMLLFFSFISTPSLGVSDQFLFFSGFENYLNTPIVTKEENMTSCTQYIPIKAVMIEPSQTSKQTTPKKQQVKKENAFTVSDDERCVCNWDAERDSRSLHDDLGGWAFPEVEGSEACADTCCEVGGVLGYNYIGGRWTWLVNDVTQEDGECSEYHKQKKSDSVEENPRGD